MKKIKYYYNTNTLRYEKLETPLRVKLLRVFGFLSASIVTAIIIVSIAYRLFPSTKEKMLMRQNDAMLQNYLALDEQTKKLQQQLMNWRKEITMFIAQFSKPIRFPDSARAKELEQQKEIQLVQGMGQYELETSILSTLNNLTRRMNAQEKSYTQIDQFIKNKEELLACTPAIQPVSNKDLKRIASGFGHRIDPVYKTVKFHAGLDFTAPQGTPIYASANGTVKIAAHLGHGYGNHVVINHGYGYETLYGHMYQDKSKTRSTRKAW